MIATELAASQVARFAVFSNFPVIPEARAELVKTLARISLTPSHAEAIADAALASCRFSPTPLGLSELARETAPQYKPPEPEGCELCSDGRLPGLYLVTWHGTKATAEPITRKQAIALRDKLGLPKQMVYSAVRTCTCEAGKRQAQLDATYAAYVAEKGERSTELRKTQRRAAALGPYLS